MSKESYCNTWRLAANLKKTKIVVVSGDKQKLYRFTLKGSEIEVTRDYKYLSIYFIGGALIKAKTQIADQADKALFAVLKKIRSFSLPVDLKIKIKDKGALFNVAYYKQTT